MSARISESACMLGRWRGEALWVALRRQLAPSRFSALTRCSIHLKASLHVQTEVQLSEAEMSISTAWGCCGIRSREEQLSQHPSSHASLMSDGAEGYAEARNTAFEAQS